VQARSAVSAGLWQQTVAADDPGAVGEGLARQRQRGRGRTASKPLGGRCGSWSIASSTRAFTTSQVGFCGNIHCTCAQDAVTFMTREQFMLAFTARSQDLNGDNNGVVAAMTED